MATSQGPYLAIAGSSAFSDFRLARIAKEIGAIDVRAVWIHYVNPLAELGGEQRQILNQLLEYGSRPSEQDRLYQILLDGLNRGGEVRDPNTSLYYVSPRPGTVSPWSSRATNIAHVCGLDKHVKRVERGLAIAATFEKMPEGVSIPNPDMLHDRMTQIISMTPPSLETMFAESEPAEAEQIDLYAGGKSPKESLQAANKAWTGFGRLGDRLSCHGIW